MSNSSYDSLAGYCNSIAGTGQQEADSCTCYYTMEYAQDLLKSFQEKTAANQAKYDDALNRWNTAHATQQKALEDYWSGCRIKEGCTEKSKCCKQSSSGDWHGKCNTYGDYCDYPFDTKIRHSCGMPDDNVKKYVDKNLKAWENYYQKPEPPTTQQQPDLKIACCSDSISGTMNDYSNVLQTCSATICDDGGCTDSGGGGDGGGGSNTNAVYCTKDTTCIGFANRCVDNVCKRKPFLVWGLVLLSLGLITFFILTVYYGDKWRKGGKNLVESSKGKTKAKPAAKPAPAKPAPAKPAPKPAAKPAPAKPAVTGKMP
jgi:hypothetical protein